MARDINDLTFQNDVFGYGGKKHRLRLQRFKQMPRSNTEFLNLFGSGNTPKAKAIKKDYFARIDALPVTDQAGRDALFAELETKLSQLNAPSTDVADVQKAKDKSKRGEKIASEIGRAHV